VLGLKLETRSKRRRLYFSLYVYMCDVFVFITFPVCLSNEPYSKGVRFIFGASHKKQTMDETPASTDYIPRCLPAIESLLSFL